jgi:hypothetical protein
MMDIHKLKKSVMLTCTIYSSRRLWNGRFDMKAGNHFFPSLEVNEMHVNRSIPSNDRVIIITCDRQTRMLPKQIQEAMKDSDLEFTGIKTNEIIRMKVKKMVSEWTLIGSGEKTYQPCAQICSLQVERNEIQKLKVYFPDSSSEVPEAQIYDLSDEIELALMDALSANINCMLVW